MRLGRKLQISVLAIGEVGRVQVCTGHELSSQLSIRSMAHARRTPLPGYHNGVIGTIDLWVPGAPAFVEAWWDKTRHDPFELWAPEQIDMHSIRILLQQREEYVCSRAWAGTR